MKLYDSISNFRSLWSVMKLQAAWDFHEEVAVNNGELLIGHCQTFVFTVIIFKSVCYLSHTLILNSNTDISQDWLINQINSCLLTTPLDIQLNEDLIILIHPY